MTSKWHRQWSMIWGASALVAGLCMLAAAGCIDDPSVRPFIVKLAATWALGHAFMAVMHIVRLDRCTREKNCGYHVPSDWESARQS